MFVNMIICIFAINHTEDFYIFFICVYSYGGARNVNITVLLIYREEIKKQFTIVSHFIFNFYCNKL